MISASMLLCALALVASIFAVAVSLTSSHQSRKLSGEVSMLRTALRNYAAKHERELKAVTTTTPPAVLAEVAALSVAVGKLADTQRRFQGRFDARMGREHAPVANGDTAVDDPEVQAMLALQSAPPASPR